MTRASAAPPPASRSAFSKLPIPLSRADLSTLGISAAALLLYRFLPAVLWLLPFAYLAVYLTYRLSRLAATDRRWILVCAVTAAGMQIGVNLLAPPYNPATKDYTFWVDDRMYFESGASIAEAWRQRFFPDLSRAGSPPYVGSHHTGYNRVLGGLFYIAGSRVQVAQSGNILCVFLLPILCSLIASTLFQEYAPLGSSSPAVTETSVLPPHNQFPTARWAALLALLYPSTYYWGRLLLKDLMLTTWFLAALLLLLDAARRPRVFTGLGFLLSLFWVTIFRNYAGLSLLLAACTYPLARLRLRYVLWGIVYAGVALLLVSYTYTGGRYLEELLGSFLSLLPKHLATVKGVFLQVGSSIPRLLFSPYAWVKAEGPYPPLYALYPGMWYLYLVIYPLALAGTLEVLRRDHRLSIIPLAAVLPGTVFFLLAYGGNAPRQRLYVELVAVVYAALGLSSPFRRWTRVLVPAVLFLFAAAQLLRLAMRQ